MLKIEYLSLENDKFCCSEDDKFVVFGWGDRLEFSGFDFFKFDYEVYEYIDNLIYDVDESYDSLPTSYQDIVRDHVVNPDIGFGDGTDILIKNISRFSITRIQ